MKLAVLLSWVHVHCLTFREELKRNLIPGTVHFCLYISEWKNVMCTRLAQNFIDLVHLCCLVARWYYISNFALKRTHGKCAQKATLSLIFLALNMDSLVFPFCARGTNSAVWWSGVRETLYFRRNLPNKSTESGPEPVVLTNREWLIDMNDSLRCVEMFGWVRTKGLGPIS